ncbi:MAG: hypothetical protein JW724_05145 [Candidatus Altiarchaeota archaeon]|nr:hypothetical protein [Candidatus Altiarchaeota archaeon]
MTITTAGSIFILSVVVDINVVVDVVVTPGDVVVPISQIVVVVVEVEILRIVVVAVAVGSSVSHILLSLTSRQHPLSKRTYGSSQTTLSSIQPLKSKGIDIKKSKHPPI